MLFTPRSAPAPAASKNGNDSFFKSRVQAKLAIGKPGDVYEQEADHMADTVVSGLKEPGTAAAEQPAFFAPKPVVQQKPQETIQQKETTEEPGQEEEDVQEAPEIQKKPLAESITPLVQTSLQEEPVQEKCATCGSEENVSVQAKCAKCAAQEKQPVQAKCADCEAKEKEAQASGNPVVQKCEQCEQEQQVQAKGATASGAGLSEKLSASKGGGTAMDTSTSEQMGTGFGTDFSSVRIHTGSEAVQMNRELGSHAFTNGSDIYFNSGKYDPGSEGGKRLLAHELTHTVQQGAVSGVQQKEDTAFIQKEDACAPPQEQGSQAAAQAAETAAPNAACAVSNPTPEQPPEGQAEPDEEEASRDIEATEGGPVDQRQSHAPPPDEGAPADEQGIQEGAQQGAEQSLDPCAQREQAAAGGGNAEASAAAVGSLNGLVPQPSQGQAGAGAQQPAAGEAAAQPAGGQGAGQPQQQEGSFLAETAARGVSPLVNGAGLGEEASPELMAERDETRVSAEESIATVGATKAAVDALVAGGAQYQAAPGKNPKARSDREAANAKVASFMGMAGTHIGGIIDNGMALASGIRTSVEEHKAALLGDIAVKRASVSGFYARSRASAAAKAEAAKANLAGQHAVTLLQIEMSAVMANMQVQVAHQAKTEELRMAYEAQLAALGQSYRTGYDNLIAAGDTKGAAAETAAAVKAAEYRRAEGASGEIQNRVQNHEKDGFWDGYLSYNRYMARANAAGEVGKQYKEGMVSQAKSQADKMMCGQAKDNEFMGAIFQKGNEMLQCALQNAQDAINRQKQAAIMQATHNQQQMTATIDQSLAATTAQLNEKEATQLQLLNDYGIRQLMAIERDGEHSIATAMNGVNTAAGQLLQFLTAYKQTIDSSEAPKPDVFSQAQMQAEAQFTQAVTQAETAVAAAIDASVLAVNEGANQVMSALQQLYDGGISDAQQLVSAYESSVDALVASGTTIYGQILASTTQAIQGEQLNGVNTVTGIVTGITGLLTNISTATDSKFTEAQTAMETGMQQTIDTELAQKICNEAEKAAADVQPWWKTALKILLVIVVIIVVALVIGPAVIGAVGAAASALAGSLGAGAALAGTIGAWAGPIIGGAIVGALSGAVIQVGNNLIDIAGTDRALTWDSVTKGVVGAMVAGAIGGALGGLGGQFAQVLLGRFGGALSAGWKFAADLGINTAFDFFGGIVGDLGSCAVDAATCHPFSWESVLMGMAIGGAVQVSMGGLSALARPHGTGPHVDAGVNPHADAGATPHVGGEVPAGRPTFGDRARSTARRIQDFQGRMTEAGQNFGNRAGFGPNAPTAAGTRQGITDANARMQKGEFFPTRPRDESAAPHPGASGDAQPNTRPHEEADAPNTRPETETETPAVRPDEAADGPVRVDSDSDLKPNTRPQQDEMASPGRETFERRQVLYDSDGQPLPNNRPRRSGDPVFNQHGERIMTPAELKAFRDRIRGWSQNGLEVKIEIDPHGRNMPDGAAAAFDYATGTIHLRNKPTMLELFHESMHARHWLESGGEAGYTGHGAMAREEYVFREIMRNKHMFNEAEILRSQRVIYRYRNGDFPPPGWRPPSTADYQTGVDWRTVPAAPTASSGGPSAMPHGPPGSQVDGMPNEHLGWDVLSTNSTLSNMKAELENGTVPRRFEGTLTVEEEATLRFYTTQEGYKLFNQALRGQIPMTDFYHAQRNVMDSALEKLPISHYNEAPEMFYRIENMENDLINQTYVKGEEITLNALVSTSHSLEAIRGAMRNRLHSHLIRIRGKNGRLIEGLSTFAVEAEVVFRPGTKFKVVEMTTIDHPNVDEPSSEIYHTGINSQYGVLRVIVLQEL